jgi:hypothetical protein
MLSKDLLSASASDTNFDLSYITALGSTTDATTYTFNDVDFGNPKSTREIFVITLLGSTSARTFSSVTIGGVSATGANFGGGDTAGVQCWFATVPTGATGTVVVTCSGGVTRVSVLVYRVVNRVNIGQNQTTSVTGAGILPSSVTNTITVPGLGFSLAVITFAANRPNVASTTHTRDVYNTLLSAEGVYNAGFSYRETSSSSNTFSTTLSWETGSASFRYMYWNFNS